MRNLKLVTTGRAAWVEQASEATHLSVDQDTGDIYLATASSLHAFTLGTAQNLSSQINLLQQGIQGQPIGLQYLCDQQSVCVATQDGQLCLWGKAMDQVESVGEVPQGLTGMAWSPDLELFVITTGNNTLILMTREFDAITELPLFSDHEREENPVSVGWGKKETQFHGSAGKEAAKKTVESQQPVSKNDPGTISIRWRGDGQFFVINAIDPNSGARSLYVWSRECVFQSKSEIVNGLQHSLAWKPSGAIIASVQTKGSSNEQEVIFFEKNGLRHGQFPIVMENGKDIIVRQIGWNQDSTVLCMWLEDCTSQTSEIRLMTVNNYHWYLKQSLRYSHILKVVEWDSEALHSLYVASEAGLHTYTWTWDTCRTLGAYSKDLASVAVIDGAKVLVTPMRRMVVPPPMAAFTLTLPAPANMVAFDPIANSNDLSAVMANGEVALFRYQDKCDKQGCQLDAAGGEGFAPQCDLPTLTNILRFPNDSNDSEAVCKHHFLWVGENKVIYVTNDESTSCSQIHIGEMKLDENTIVERCSLPVEGCVIAMALGMPGSHAAAHMKSGNVIRVDLESETILPWESSCGEVCFPYPCPTMAVTQIGGEEVVLGLTDKFRFYVNDCEVASNCTSFAIHKDFLLLTTLSHTVRFIHRSTKVSELPKLSDVKDHPFDENVRRVERGSRIVSVVADDTKLVLQMPRGNLETFNPRALVLSALQRLLNSGQISEAFVMMRKHRVNLNLLYDHDPDSFTCNVDEFIRQIDSVNNLNLFITELTEDDVTRTMYTASYQRAASDSNVPDNKRTGFKVDLICDVLISAFKRLGEDKYLLPILTAHVKKTKPEYEKALLIVWSLQDNKAETESVCSSVSPLEALKYLLFLVDVNTMYDVALGTYNFDLVMMVAQHSQKDPKEYIPFLNELRRLDENYRHFTIDKHLKKFSSALENISKCGDEHFEESVALITEHKLYSKALRLYRGNPKHFKEIAALYGRYLKSKNRNDEAGIMLTKAEEWSSAMECFRADCDWRQVFAMAARLKYSPNQTMELAKNVSEDLKNHQRYADAAIVLEEYAQNPEEAIVCLIQGNHWTEAVRKMHVYDHLDLIETHLWEALAESFDQHQDILTRQREEFDRHKQRLCVVRADKEKAHRMLLEGVSDYNDAEADLYSDITSVTGASVTSRRTYDSSRSTVFSKATGKSSQRGGKKKWSLKEGSANEEFALIEALAKIIKYIDGFKEEVNKLLKALVQFNEDDKAVQLQEMYADFLSVIQASIAQIWQESNTADTSVNTLGPNATANSIAVAMQRQRGQEVGEKLDPVLCVPPTLNKDSRWKLHMAGDQDR